MSSSAIKFQKYNIFMTKLFNLIISLNPEQQRFLLKKAEELILREKRECARKDCSVPVRYISHNAICNDFVINICRNGCFIETLTPLLLGEEILMDIRFGDCDSPVRIRGEVVHINRIGMGIEFKEGSSYLSELLRKLFQIPSRKI